MAYSKTTWADRAVQYPNKYTKSGETSTEVTLVPNAGTVTQAGTPINAANMNKIEQGIQDAHTTADNALPKSGGTTTGKVEVINQTVLGSALNSTMDVFKASGNTGGGSITGLVTRLVRNTAGGAGWDTTDVDIVRRTDVTDQQPYIRFHSNGKMSVSVGTVLDIITPTGLMVNGSLQAQTRVNGGVLEFWDGTQYKGAGGVKNVQRGTTAVSGTTTTTVNVAISSVNMAKSFITVSATGNKGTSDGTGVRAKLTSSTNLELSTWFNETVAITFQVNWEIVEFY